MKNKNDFFLKNYVINESFIKEIKNLNLNLDEFIMLVYFLNIDSKKLDIQNISSHIPFNEEDILSIIDSLIGKKLLDLTSRKDERGKLADFINLEGLFEYLSNDNKKQCNKIDIYSVFEKEFGRTISSMEYEIINAWIERDFTEELILLALKEAVYNGVFNLRYIDKILFEWQKKGIKNKHDVESYINRKNQKKSNDDLFDYNWLADEGE